VKTNLLAHFPYDLWRLVCAFSGGPKIFNSEILLQKRFRPEGELGALFHHLTTLLTQLGGRLDGTRGGG